MGSKERHGEQFTGESKRRKQFLPGGLPVQHVSVRVGVGVVGGR